MLSRYDCSGYLYMSKERLKSSIWESQIKAPDMKFAEYRQKGAIRHFHLVAESIKHRILSNLTIEALGYSGVTPGPLIIMHQGEWIYLTVENRLDEPTALHVHGLLKPNSEDGVPDINPTTPSINPGDSYTYKFLCWQSGTFFIIHPRLFKYPKV